jgi:hypothetical protein
VTPFLGLTARGLRSQCTATLLTRRIGPTVQIRRYTTGKPPPVNSWTNMLAGATAWLTDWWDGGQPKAQVHIAALTTQPPPKVKVDPWECETNWVATPPNRENPSLNHPTTWEYLFRDMEDVKTLFTGGMPPPGDDFDLQRHVHRSVGDRGRDAYYGTSEATSWKGEGFDEWNGPLHHGGDYLVVLLRAKGVSVAFVLGTDAFNEREIAVHAVRPERCAAWLNKKTGQIEVNPWLDQHDPAMAIKVRVLLQGNFERLQLHRGKKFDE